MPMNRRGFLKGILLAGMAPAIVRADSLMKIIPLKTEILRPGLSFFAPHPLTSVDAIAPLLWPGVKDYWGERYKEIPSDWIDALVYSMQEAKERVAANVLHKGFSDKLIVEADWDDMRGEWKR